MPNKVKYNPDGTENAIFKGNWAIDTSPPNTGGGPSNVTGFYNGADAPEGGYVIYEEGAVRTIADDTELIAYTNSKSGETEITTLVDALDWVASQENSMLVDREIENIVTDGLIMYLDSGIITSYPGSGSTWYDISGNGNNASIGVANFSSGVFESITSPGYADRLEFFTPNSTSLNNTLSVTTGGWTIQEWVRIDDATYPETIAGTVASGGAYRNTATGFDWNHGEMSMSRFEMGASSALINDNNSYDAIGAITIPSPYNTFGVWYCRHLYWDRDNNQMGLYYNDAHMGSISMGVLDGYSVYDGGGISWGQLYGWRHEGARSSIKIWNRVLSSAEVSQNYNAQKDRFEI